MPSPTRPAARQRPGGDGARSREKGVFIVRHRGRFRASIAVLATALAASGTRAATEADGPDKVSASEIVVLGSQGKGYKIDELTTATRTGTDIMSVPQSIQFVPRQVIDDQQILDLTSALRNVSGVLPGTDAGNRSESFTIRGFRSSYYAVDSIMLSPAIQTNDSFRDLANVERIEVLKGRRPAAQPVPRRALGDDRLAAHRIQLSHRTPADRLADDPADRPL
jgi:outer membrane receptor protein involved in Fe transport